MVGVYKITNRITGDFYIGKSKNVRKRLNNHHQKGIHSKKFDDDIEKYGWSSFDKEIIEECNPEDLLEREAFYIRTMNPTYNKIVRGRKLEDNVKKIISEKLKGKKQSEETKAKRRASIRKRHEKIPQTNAGHKKIVFVDGIEFQSVGDAEKYIGCSTGYLSRMNKCGRTKCKGHEVWYVV